MTVAEQWRCGDCGSLWQMDVQYCRRPFDDYLSLRGGSIEAAIGRILQPYLDRLDAVEQKANPRPKITARTVPFAIAS